MNTIELPHSEYSSGLKSYSPQNSGEVDHITPKRKNTRTNSQTNETPKANNSAPQRTEEERSLFHGVFVDVFKTVAKILTGSLLTDVLKGFLKDGNQTWQQIVYRTCVDSFPSRFITDVVCALSIRFFNGNHSFFGLFNLPKIPAELISQIAAVPSVALCRAATAHYGVNKNSAEGNQSPQEAEILQRIQSDNRWSYSLSQNLQVGFNKYLKTPVDKVLSVLLGVHAGELIVDKEGKAILDANGKEQHQNPHVNTKWLGGIMTGSFLGSFFLPKHTQAQGFEDATSFLRGLWVVLFTSLARLNTTLVHNGVGMHFEAGSNFDKCFKTSVVEKMLVPFTQYFANFLGAFASKRLPINGAILSIIMTFLLEIPATFLSSGLVNVAKKDRMSGEWTHLAQTVWKPTSDFIEHLTTPLFTFAYKYVIGPLTGMFDPKIPNMYGVNIGNPEPEAQDTTNLPKGFVTNLGLFAKKCLELPYEVKSLAKQCVKDASRLQEEINDQVRKHNEAIDLRRSAEAALQKLKVEGKESIKIDQKNTHFNRELVRLANEGKPVTRAEIEKLNQVALSA